MRKANAWATSLARLVAAGTILGATMTVTAIAMAAVIMSMEWWPVAFRGLAL